MAQASRLDINLSQEVLSHLPLADALMFPPLTPLNQVLRDMQERLTHAVLIQENGKVLGIFTERDVLTRLMGKDIDLNRPVGEFMTRNPLTLGLHDTLEDAVRLMAKNGFRNIPLWDASRSIARIISVRDVIDYLAEQFPNEVLNLPPDIDSHSPKAEGG